MGVFQIRNTVNGKILVESSPNLDAIWNRNRMQLEWGKHPNRALQSDWNELGADHFKFEILAEIEQEGDEQTEYSKELKTLETLYKEELSPYGERGYNSTPR